MRIIARTLALSVAFVLAATAILTGCGASNPVTATAVPSAKTIYTMNQIDVNTNTESILEFTVGSNGSVAPAGTLTPPKGFYSYSIATDTSGQIYLAGYDSINMVWKVLIYAAGATGTPSILREIDSAGPNNGGFYQTFGMAVDTAGNLYLTSFANTGNNGSIFVFPSNAQGTATPSRVISGANTNLGGAPLAIAVDATGTIYAASRTNKGSTAQIYAFAPGANGNITPVRNIGGSSTGIQQGIQQVCQLAVDSSNNVYASINNITPFTGTSLNSNILEFSSTASGNVAPIRTLAVGLDTSNPSVGVAVDAAGNLYTAGVNFANLPTAETFSPTATGSATPTDSFISSAWINNNQPLTIAVH